MLLGDDAAQLSACTVHSWCMSLIRRMPGMFGCEGYSVIDREDQLRLFKVVCGRDAGAALSPAADLCDIYSFARNCTISLSQSLTHFDADLLRSKQSISQAFSTYEQRKKDRKYLDYDDVIDVVATVLRDDEDVRHFVATKYDHILVDEMQDTNPLQWQLLEAIRQHVLLYCVGDDAQSIYGFRGADFRNVHSFADRVPGSTVLKLQENYRSTQPILDLANWLLRQSPLAYDKELLAVRGAGPKPKLLETESEWDEGQWIANDVVKSGLEGPHGPHPLSIRRTIHRGSVLCADLRCSPRYATC
jgi:DNA helicase-2/ATP-dependent DNA helicase PcrA